MGGVVMGAGSSTADAFVSAGPEIFTHMGIHLPLDPQIISPAIAESIRAGRYEKTEAKVLPGIIEPGERVVDVGGGLGFTAAVMARTGRAERVVCVEAHPGLIPLIEAVRELNAVDFEVRHAAVAPAPDGPTTPFYLAGHFWASSLLPMAQARLSGVAEIPALSFADLVRAYAPTMYVIDIEVLKEFIAPAADGLDGLDSIALDGVAKVVVQTHQNVAGRRGVKRVFDWFSARGFVYSPLHSRGDVVLFERLGGDGE